MGKKPIQLQDAYQVFMLEIQSRKYTASTIEFYRCRLTAFLAWCAEQQTVHLGDVTPAILRGYFIHLQERGLVDYSVNAAARAIKAFLNFCVDEELIVASPMRKVTTPKIAKRILPAFTPDDIKKLLGVCETERDRAVVLFLLDTGLRAQEFIKLNGGDIDIKVGTVAVHEGKGQKDRTCYFGAKARKALLRYYLQRGTPGEKEPIWLTEREQTRITQSGLNQLLQRLGKKAGVKDCKPHTFRRTFALWSLRNGMNIYALARIMGHTDIAILRQYLALVDGDAKAAHDQHGAVDNMMD